MKVEVAVLGSPSLIIRTVSVDVNSNVAYGITCTHTADVHRGDRDH